MTTAAGSFIQSEPNLRPASTGDGFVAHSQRQLKPVERGPDAQPPGVDVGEVRMASAQTVIETQRQLADYEIKARTGQLGEKRPSLSIGLPLIIVLGGFGVLAHFAGLIVTLVTVAVILSALALCLNWILDNTIEL